MAENKLKPDDVATGSLAVTPPVAGTRTSVTQFPKMTDAEVQAFTNTPVDRATQPAIPAVKKPIADLAAMGGAGALIPPAITAPYRAAKGVANVVRNLDAMIPTPEAPMGRTYDEAAKVVATPAVAPKAIAPVVAPVAPSKTTPAAVGPRLPSPSGPTPGMDAIPTRKTLNESLSAPATPAPAIGGNGVTVKDTKDASGRVIATDIQGPPRGVTTGAAPAITPPSIAPAVSSGGEMIPRAPAIPQAPDITIPVFGERMPTAQLTWAGATPQQETLTAQAHQENLRGYNERLAAHQKATYAASLAKAGFTNDQIVQILKGGAERDVAKTKAEADVAVGKYGADITEARTAAISHKEDIRTAIKQTNDNLDSRSKELDAMMKDPLADKEVIRSIRHDMEMERQRGIELRKQLSLPEGAVGDGAAIPSAAATTRPRNIGEAMARAKSMGATQFKFDGQTYPVQ